MFITFLKRTNRPAEIINVHPKIGHCLVYPPILRERVRLPHLPGILVPVGRVVPLQERHVDPPAHPRRGDTSPPSDRRPCHPVRRRAGNPCRASRAPVVFPEGGLITTRTRAEVACLGVAVVPRPRCLVLARGAQSRRGPSTRRRPRAHSRSPLRGRLASERTQRSRQAPRQLMEDPTSTA